MNQPFVASLDPAEWAAFIANYEIVASSAGNAKAEAAGLDAIVLRSRTTQEISIAQGGVGPYDLELTEGVKLLD